MKKRTLIVIATAGVVALGGGTAVALADEDTREQVTRTVTGGETAKTDLTVEQAIAKAQEAVKGTVESVELEDDGSAWELEVLAEDGSWHDAKIDAKGEVTREASDDDSGKSDDSDDSVQEKALDKAEADALKAAKTPASQAASAAVGSVSGAVTSVEFENTGDKPAWKVEVKDGGGVVHEVFVDAADGKVVSSRIAPADDSDDEDSDDD